MIGRFMFCFLVVDLLIVFKFLFIFGVYFINIVMFVLLLYVFFFELFC